MLTIYFSGAEGRITRTDVLTAGMVGRQMRLEFSSEWEGLNKTAVFSNGEITRDAVCSGDTVTIPAEVLTQPLKKLLIGVYGVSGGGAVAIPTVRVDGPVILPGADPSGDPGLDPELPIWSQIQAQIGDLDDLNTQARDTLVDAINEAMTVAEGITGTTFTPRVSLEGVITWTNDGNLANPEPVNIMGPQGPGPVVEVGALAGGHRIRIISNNKVSQFDVMDGADGYTPVFGVDYWTQEQQNVIRGYLEEVILGGAW